MIGSRTDRERFAEFMEVWEELTLASRRPGSVILVEGEKDRRALGRLGIASSIALVHQGQPLPSVAQALAASHGRAIVLTDWDRKGGQLAERLAQLLSGAELTVDLDLRQRLARVLRGELVHVEGLYRWASHLADAVGLSLSAALEGLRD